MQIWRKNFLFIWGFGYYRQQMKEINMCAFTNTNLLLAYVMYSAHPDFIDEHDHIHDMDADQNYTREIISDDSPRPQ